jgi:HK97 family phage prohead protease
MTITDIDRRERLAARLDGTRETRRFQATMELRAGVDGGLRFTGYASIVNHRYELSDFTEVIAPGAFKRTLSENPDVVLLINHEGLPLARTKSGTLVLTEDARGLRVDADLNADDPDVRALLPKMQRGDVDEMSFAFRTTDQSWNDDRSLRTIRGVTLHKGDVSVVTYGASDATSATLLARSFQDPIMIPDHLSAARVRLAALRADERAPVSFMPTRAIVDPLHKYRTRVAELRRG